MVLERKMIPVIFCAFALLTYLNGSNNNPLTELNIHRNTELYHALSSLEEEMYAYKDTIVRIVYQFHFVNGLAARNGDHKKKVCNIPYITSPVCASDGQTYSNVYAMKCKSPSLQVVKEGECDKDNTAANKKLKDKNGKKCVMFTKLRPICASNGQTYFNEDVMKCENPLLQVKKPGPCRVSAEKTKNCKVNSKNAPVCGSDGETYQNEDILKCKDPLINLVAQGKCNKHTKYNVCEIQNNIYQPVCATDGRKYPNKDFVKCRNISSLTVTSSSECECTFSLTEKPVCASNGKTYFNTDVIMCEDSSLNVVKQGKCNKKSDRPRNCAFRYGSQTKVCASDGQTYKSADLVKCKDPLLRLVDDKQCDRKSKHKENKCVRRNKYKPVCATDGRTYPNEDFVRCRNISSLVIKSKGMCRD